MAQLHIYIHRSRTRDNNFVEAEHPRAPDGRFGDKPGEHARHEPIRHGGKGVGWLNAEGKPISGPVAEKLKAMKAAIPPAWTDARISTDPNAKVLAMGHDKKGKLQRIYSAEHNAEADQKKFARLKELDSKIDALMEKGRKIMSDEKLPQRERDKAAAVTLIALTGLRPGSTEDTGADAQAYGATTLEKRHIKIQGSKVVMTFVPGKKKGQSITKILQDKDMARYLQSKLETIDDVAKVFTTSGDSAMSFMREVVGKQFKLKDLRTWNGTALARSLIGDSQPTSEDSLKRMQKEISEKVAQHLGNTPKVAFEYYIDPSVWPTVGPTQSIRKAA